MLGETSNVFLMKCDRAMPLFMFIPRTQFPTPPPLPASSLAIRW